ncbi:MAG TPA: AAA family ATPase, partial [Gammaproteobacteria bacterium]|nr:AAA family ATPase [Gammaproteobacteria bacterium]
MLTHIHIRDLAIIDELELELGPGMSVLTGETGAGKSILIDALGLVLGDRAASDVVRDGANKAEITLALDIRGQTTVLQWLIEQGLDAGDECFLRRVIGRDGRSKTYINGTPAPLQRVRELGEMLVDIHGQHAHQSLLRGDTQRQILDTHADNGERLERLAVTYHERRVLSQQLQELTNQGRERADRIDLLQFQVQELATLNLGPDEFDALNEEHRRLAHAGRLKDAGLAAYLALYGADDGSLDTGIGKVISELTTLCNLDDKLSEPADLLGAAQAQLREAASSLRQYSDDLDIDPERLTWVEARLSDIHDLARKYRLLPAQLLARLTELEAELASLQDPELDLEQLHARLAGV